MTAPFVHVHHVRFEEVDAAGIVFFAHFFGWCHDAMEALLSPVDGGYSGLVMRRRLGLPVVHVEADWVSPVRFGDDVRIAVAVERIGTSSVTLRFDLTRVQDDARVGTLRHVVVTTDLDELRSQPLPDDLRRVLEAATVAAPDQRQ